MRVLRAVEPVSLSVRRQPRRSPRRRQRLICRHCSTTPHWRRLARHSSRAPSRKLIRPTTDKPPEVRHAESADSTNSVFTRPNDLGVRRPPPSLSVRQKPPHLRAPRSSRPGVAEQLGVKERFSGPSARPAISDSALMMQPWQTCTDNGHNYPVLECV